MFIIGLTLNFNAMFIIMGLPMKLTLNFIAMLIKIIAETLIIQRCFRS